MGWREYDRARAEAYDAERSAPDTHLSATRDALLAELRAAPPGPLLDLGAGTGLWSDRLARWSSRPVIAAEPSEGMVAVLADKRLEGVAAVRARAEALPLRDGSCAAAWLSTVVHHFDDLAAAGREVARVLAPEGVALVRGSFPEEAAGDSYPTRFFPSAVQVATAFPTAEELVGCFEAAGMMLRRRQTLAETASQSRAEFVERVSQRADSLLVGVPDDEFASGLERMRHWAAEAPDEPVGLDPELLVLG